MAGVVAGCGGMWQGVGVCGRDQASGMDGDMWQGWVHMAGCGGMWQGVGACGRMWGHVAGCGIMWQRWGHVRRARGIWQGRVGTCGKSVPLAICSTFSDNLWASSPLKDCCLSLQQYFDHSLSYH